ncbi:MAG TPA: glycosyltransferase [Candidatus Sulfomarinibacteraceae bacterium]|nr:glycosyltransferase [Candidatus Sulfomarinibacteraceae bacterium]
MRILMVSKACLVGAYQTKLEEIARFDGVELAVVVPPVWQDPAGPIPLERSHTSGYQLYVDPIRFNGQFHLHYYPHLKKRLRQFRPHILHMDEEPYNLATWLGVRQAQRVGAHTLFFSWQNIERRYPFPFSAIERAVLKNVDYAIMGNEAAAEVWRAKGYEGPLQVIPQFGVNPEIYAPPNRRDHGRTFTIGSAGRRLVPEKGNDVLLRAVAQLPGLWRVVIAGDGPERDALEKLARELNIAKRVHFDGVIPSDQMPAYMRQLDVLVVPSRTLPNWKEQFGRVLVEAMACEVAVIGSDSGEIPNVVGDAGLIFPEGDARALAAQLCRLMQTEDLRDKLGRAGRERVLQHYTQAQVAAKTVEVYHQITAL